jgi:hypothetical protein
MAIQMEIYGANASTYSTLSPLKLRRRPYQSPSEIQVILSYDSTTLTSSFPSSAAARQSSNTSAANPRSGFVAHSHTLHPPHTLSRMKASLHAHRYDARPEQPLFTSSIEEFKYQKQPIAPVYIEEFAMNNIVNTAIADIVWLVEQEVLLPNGTKQRAVMSTPITP